MSEWKEGMSKWVINMGLYCEKMFMKFVIQLSLVKGVNGKGMYFSQAKICEKW